MSDIWEISVGGGYGKFYFEGSEQEAEEMRKHKAEWEGGGARKRLVTNRTEREAAKIKIRGRGRL